MGSRCDCLNGIGCLLQSHWIGVGVVEAVSILELEMNVERSEVDFETQEVGDFESSTRVCWFATQSLQGIIAINFYIT